MVNYRYSIYCISVTQNNCQLEKRISPISSQLGLVSNNTINESYSEISSVASCLPRNNDSHFFLVFVYLVFILAFTQEKIVISRFTTQSPSWSMWGVTRAVVATSLLSTRVRLECRGSGETCDVLLTGEYFAKNLYDNILIMFSYCLL